MDSYDSEKFLHFAGFFEIFKICIPLDLSDHKISEKTRPFFSGEEKCVHFFSPNRRDCRSRKMLKNALTLAIGGLDTAENEPCKDLQKVCKILQDLQKFVKFCKTCKFFFAKI